MFPSRQEPTNYNDGSMPVSHNEQLNFQRRFSPLVEAISTAADVEATRSLLSLAGASSNEAQETRTESNFASLYPPSGVGTIIGVQDDYEQDSDSDDIWGQSMEYATGAALRTRILDPVLRELPNDVPLPETIRFLAMNCRGDLVYVSDSNGGTQQACIERVTKDDSAVLTTWWENDKFLPYTDETWSEWWIRRCRFVDPGCEMYKLVTRQGETLGMVYFERNILDHIGFGNGGRITLIRGMRIAPHLNPQVIVRRKSVDSADDNGAANGEMFQTVATMLFWHVLYMSVRYGSDAVSVNCPKTREAEAFYQSLMGAALCFDASGRQYFRLESEGRWNTLRESFQQQVKIWLNQKNCQ